MTFSIQEHQQHAVHNGIKRQHRQNLRNYLCHATVEEMREEQLVSTNRGEHDRAAWILEMISERQELGVPVINLNGSAKSTLLDLWTDVLNQTVDLEKALCQATPHQRDYHDFTSWNGAIDSHRAQLENVENVKNHATSMLTEIYNQEGN
jgi:hypothetical protein